MYDPFTVKRRGVLMAAGAAAVSLAACRAAQVHAAQHVPQGIPQPDAPGDADFIARAFEMRRLAVDKGDQAYGAVIVRKGAIIGQSWSRVILDQDPTGHAEISAIRDAARRVGSRDLGGSVMYSSSRPCPMCEAAAYWAGIGEMIHGNGAESAGAPKLCR